MPPKLSLFDLDLQPVPTAVCSDTMIKGFPLITSTSGFDTDSLFTESLVQKSQFLLDLESLRCPYTMPTPADLNKQSSIEVQSIISNQPYEISSQRFHTIDISSDPLPSLSDAQKLLSELSVDFSLSKEKQIRRGALVFLKIQESNPTAINLELDPSQQQALRQTLFDFQDVCAFSFEDMPKPALVDEFVIDTGSSPPVSSRYFRLPPKIEDHLRTEIESNLGLGLLQTSSSPWASPLFAVPKPHKVQSYRTVADYRALNAVTVPDKYPLPLIQQIFEEIGASTYFHANDLLSGFWQVPCAPASIPKTAVTTRWGLFEYTRMPQGVRNAPSHFMRIMNKLLTEENLHLSNCAFIDDLTSHGNDFLQSLIALRNALQALRKRQMYISPLKMKWGYLELALLGHLISHQQIRCQSSKVAAILALKQPTNVSELRSFLGITGYYRAFIPKFAQTATPLFALLKKESEYVWSTQCQESFESLKASLASDPVLSVPKPDAPMILYTDWSVDAISAILHQEVNGIEHVIEFASKTCNKHERLYCPTEGELLAIIYGLSKFRSYLLGQHFTIVTDHSALQYLNSSKSSAKLARWGLFLSEFNFEVKYRKGAIHHNADALSRLTSNIDNQFDLDALICLPDTLEESVFTCSWQSLYQPVELFTLRQELLEQSPCALCGTDQEGVKPQLICDGCNNIFHLHCINIRKVPSTYWYCLPCMQTYHSKKQYDILYDISFQEYALGGRSERLKTQSQYFETLLAEGYGFSSGTLTRFFHNRLHQVPSPGRQALLLEEVHCRNGHVGTNRLYDLLCIEYWWPGMRQDCIKFVAHCLSCQLQKNVFHREVPLEHLSLPAGPRLEWHIDLAPDLPVEQGVKQLIVCQDQYTKFILLGVVNRRTSSSIAEWFNTHVISIFGVPETIRTDQGSEFKGAFSQMCTDTRIHHHTIATEAPWSNGVAEQLVRTVKSYLTRLALTEGELNWPAMLPNIQLGYNLAKHAALNLSPFEIMFGGRGRFIIEEPSLPTLPFRPSPTQYLQYTKSFLKEVEQRILHNRQQAAKSSSTSYDSAPVTDGARKKSAKSLSIGQLVAIRRHPRTHLGVSSIGPFIIAKIEGTYVWVRSLTSGRQRREHRVNVIPLQLEFESGLFQDSS